MTETTQVLSEEEIQQEEQKTRQVYEQLINEKSLLPLVEVNIGEFIEFNSDLHSDLFFDNSNSIFCKAEDNPYSHNPHYKHSNQNLRKQLYQFTLEKIYAYEEEFLFWKSHSFFGEFKFIVPVSGILHEMDEEKDILYIFNLEHYLDLEAEKAEEIHKKEAEKKRLDDARKAELEAAQKAEAARKKQAQAALTEIDYRVARLPLLSAEQLSDPDQGLWELSPHKMGVPERLRQAIEAFPFAVQARHPEQDLRLHAHIAIDFGTSSTVVAVRDQGHDSLLRIGEGDFWAPLTQNAYENPTLLEFLDWAALEEAWLSEVYRPPVSWETVRCSHEARASLHGHLSDAKIIGSLLNNLKQWALRDESPSSPRVRLKDQKTGAERILSPLQKRSPVKGRALKINPEQYPFDPIELYAWFLGMFINWRGKGLYLRYFMTFPVTYSLEVKSKILFAFQRGLQRSLPAALTESPHFSKFLVEEWASEPTAYAASALPALGLSPTQAGRAYAVFDFGGGTTDFDFGYYRLPTEAEEEAGYEAVLDHFGASGDTFLGGENLLEHLAYSVFQHNLEACRQGKITFTCPLDAKPFAGSEMFLERTNVARTNTLKLVSFLRPFWESSGQEAALNISEGLKKFSFLTPEGQSQEIGLKFNVQQLRTQLDNRIFRGIEAFFCALKEAFQQAETPFPSQLDILLAGNASRSKWVLDYFGLGEDEESLARFEQTKMLLARVFGECNLDLVVHPAKQPDPHQPHLPTAKTGVALGLLNVCPGEPLKIIERAIQAHYQEAPFGHFVGKMVQQRFQPVILAHGTYREWTVLGVPLEGTFRLTSTASPRAQTGAMERTDPDLTHQLLHFEGRLEGLKVCAKALRPNELEICLAPSAETADDPALSNQHRVIFL